MPAPDPMASEIAVRLGDIPATGHLTFGHELGDLDQHDLCPLISQFVKGLQQA
jgi:hypothetical protein